MPRANGVEVNIVAKPCQPVPILDDDALESALEQVPAFLSQLVEAICGHALQPAHALA